MKIGVDATCWGNKRGFGRFTRELLESVLDIDTSNEYLFFTDDKTPESASIPEQVHKIVVPTSASQVRAASANGNRLLKDLWAMSREVFRHRVDVFFFPAVYSYFPIFNRTKIIVTVHDLIADHHPQLIFPNSRAKFFWKIKQRAAIRQADLILTVSEYSKQQISRHFDLPKSSLRVVNEGARPIFKVLPKDNALDQVLKKYGLGPGEKFLLYVGGISPHKNLDTLIEAFGRLTKMTEYAAIKLLLVGDYRDDPFYSAYPALKEQTAKSDLENKVIFTGYIPDEDLAVLYNTTALLVFPSFEEGFGLPAIEAMSCGAPVAASNCSSLPEVIGDAGRFFDPRDAQHMVRVIGQILDGDDVEKDLMSQKSLGRAAQFSWNKAAADLLQIFEDLRQQ